MSWRIRISPARNRWKADHLGGKDTWMISNSLYDRRRSSADQIDKNVGGTILTVDIDPARANSDDVPAFRQGLLEDHRRFRREDQGKLIQSRQRCARSFIIRQPPGLRWRIQNYAGSSRAKHIQPAASRALSGKFVRGLCRLSSPACMECCRSWWATAGANLVSAWRWEQVGRAWAQMVLRQEYPLIAVGLAVGIAIAFPAERLIKSFLYQVPAAVNLRSGSGRATRGRIDIAFLPARKAASIQPMKRRGKIESGTSSVVSTGIHTLAGRRPLSVGVPRDN